MSCMRRSGMMASESASLGPPTPSIVALVRRGHAGLVSVVSDGPEGVLPADGAPGATMWRAGISRASVAYFRISSTRFCVSARIGAMGWVVVTIVWIPLTIARLTSMMFFTGNSACAYGSWSRAVIAWGYFAT